MIYPYTNGWQEKKLKRFLMPNMVKSVDLKKLCQGNSFKKSLCILKKIKEKINKLLRSGDVFIIE